MDSTAADRDGMAAGSSWKWTALIVLTGINLLNYIDRYIFSALGPALQKDLSLSDAQLGFLGSGFILAYIALAPICGWLGDRGSRPRLMASGVALWSVATAFSGVAGTFFSQLVTRVFVGLGESVYTVIAPATLADFFSKSMRGRVFAIYSGAIPIGSALGYILGEQFEKIFGWQKTFMLVGVPGIICAIVAFFIRDPRAIAGAEKKIASKRENPWRSFFVTCGQLFQNGGFNSVVFGYAAYTFVVGGMAFWMPVYIDRYFHVANGITIFGAVTVVGGFLGTLLGGWWADRIERKTGNGYLKVSIWSIVLATPLFVVVLAMTDFQSFMIALFLMEVALFLCMSPLDAAVITFVKPQMRATAMALNVFLIHALGDGISRALVGSVSDATGLRGAMSYFPWVLVLAGIIWFLGLVLYWHPVAWPEGFKTLPQFQAHRGWWKESGHQENTLEAFRAARTLGVEMVEMDVQLSGDGKVVVFHDRDLKRLGKLEQKVSETSAADLRRLVGAPLLEEVLHDDGVPNFLNVELKSSSVFNGHLESAVAAVIRASIHADRILFSSFNPFSLRRLAKLLPEIPRALLVTEYPDKDNRIWFRKMWFGFWARPHLLHLDKEMIYSSRMRAWQERGIPIVAWTVNDPSEAKKLLALGTKSIISDQLKSV